MNFLGSESRKIRFTYHGDLQFKETHKLDKIESDK